MCLPSPWQTSIVFILRQPRPRPEHEWPAALWPERPIFRAATGQENLIMHQVTAVLFPAVTFDRAILRGIRRTFGAHGVGPPSFECLLSTMHSARSAER